MESRHSSTRAIATATATRPRRSSDSSRVNDIRAGASELDDTAALLGLLERSKRGVDAAQLLHISRGRDVMPERATSSSTPSSSSLEEEAELSQTLSSVSKPAAAAPEPPALSSSLTEAMENNPFAPLSQGPTLDEKPPLSEKPSYAGKPTYAEKLKEPAPSKKPTEVEKPQRPSKKPAAPFPRASEKRRTTKRDNQKIQWAPLNIGVEKRAQTAIVLWHSLSIASFVALFFFTCAIPLLWPLLIPYLVYVLLFSDAATNGNLKLRSEFFRSLWIWRYFGNYFPAQLHRTVPLVPTRKYVFGYHPHGIISHGAFVGFGTDGLGFSKLFPGITNTLLTLDSNFQLPFYREYALLLGLGSVSKESCENILSKGGYNGEGMGRAVTIVVGGARESLEAQPHNIRLILKRRKGFVKLAVRTGADLVPVLAFGENELYEQVRKDEHPYVHKAQLLVKKIMGFTVPLFHARGVFNYDVGMMPYRRPLNIVVGRPIEVVQCEGEQPDPEYVDQLHEQYIQELERMWEEHRLEFAPESEPELEVL